MSWRLMKGPMLAWLAIVSNAVFKAALPSVPAAMVTPRNFFSDGECKAALKIIGRCA